LKDRLLFQASFSSLSNISNNSTFLINFLSELIIAVLISFHLMSLFTTKFRSKLFIWNCEISVAFIIEYAQFVILSILIKKKATLDFISNLFEISG
jgi:hypothetical protein